MKKALFPGSFDPFTLGHLDLLHSALKIFDKVVVAVGYNIQKSGFFSVEERVKIIEQSVKGLQGVEVTSYRGLTIDYCREIGAKFIIRGLRTTADFESETTIAQANKQLDHSVTTLFIPSNHQFTFISSSVVRDIVHNGGDATKFMAKGVAIPKNVKR